MNVLLLSGFLASGWRLLKHSLLALFLVLLGTSSPLCMYGQWGEDFNSYPDGAQSGYLNINTANPATDWLATCAGCIFPDTFVVMNGKLEAMDTNGPATWVSELIDISGMTSGAQFSMDFEKVGNLEACGASCSPQPCCIDFIRVEYRVDGTSWQSLSHTNGGICSDPCTGGNFVALGDFTAFSINHCVIGSTLELRVIFQNWAQSEIIRMDNVAVVPVACVLSIEGFQNFQATLDASGGVFLSWELMQTPLSSTETFEIERSTSDTEGDVLFESIATVDVGSGHEAQASDIRSYQFTDHNTPHDELIHYRIKQIDTEGFTQFSNIQTLRYHEQVFDVQVYIDEENAYAVLNAYRLHTDGVRFALHNMHGETLAEGVFLQKHQVSLESLKPALYWFVFYSHTGETSRKLFIKY